MKYVVFTDMDGTLLDHDTYSYDAARPVLELLRRRGIPLVICTSKTRVEIEKFRVELDISDPFISENGGAIFVPKGYFAAPFEHDKETGEYLVIELGTPYDQLRKALSKVARATECKIRGFGDMTAQVVSEDSGLDIESARLSKEREYDEPFKIVSKDERCSEKILEEIRNHGLSYTTGGRYNHIMGDNDKGKVVSILADIFRHEDDELTTIGLGDSLNDLLMLEAVDVPVLVQKPNKTYEPGIKIDVKRADGVGPNGWNSALMEILM